jgi:hypothetical protein
MKLTKQKNTTNNAQKPIAVSIVKSGFVCR